MSSADANIVSASVDYIACSSPNIGTGRRFFDFGRDLLEEQKQLGNDVRPFRRYTFDGERAGRVSVASSADHHLVQLEGEPARDYWHQLHQLAASTSRIDYELTAHDPTKSRHAVAEAWHCLETREQEWNGPRTWERAEIRPYGDIVRVGSRQSTRYLRIYDWGVKHKTAEPLTHWRYESEYKGLRAIEAAARLQSAPAEREVIVSTITAELAHVKIDPIFRADAGERMPEHRPPTDDETRLRWLRESVLPCIELLIAHGREAAVYEALNLGPPARASA
jgi:DNA relaxase NicK